jgi:sugar/nucleoside kinase (ribokinase family)
VLISSSEFPRRLTGIEDEREALKEVKTRLHDRAVVGMTLGARGALLYHEGTFTTAHAFPVPGGCRDTTGAGDAFHAGFLYAMLQGEEIESCLTLGCAVAALKCRDLGARAALPNASELNQFLTAEGETS